MNRNDLKTKFNFYGTNDDISLYRKRGEFNYGMGYCGNIALKNGKALFQGKSYSNLDDLDAALKDWENSLPFPVDTYNPMMNPNYRVRSRIEWHLTEKLGFKHSTENWDSYYVKNIGPNFGIKFRIDDKNDNVNIFSVYGSFTFSQNVTDENAGITVINTIVNVTVLEMTKDIIDAISVCDEKITSDIDTYVKSNKNIFGIEKTDFKSTMINRLENVLNQLKNS